MAREPVIVQSSKTPLSMSKSNRTLYIIALNHAVNDGSVYLLTALFPLLRESFNISYLQIGILLGTGYFVPVICQPIIGRYGEYGEARKLLASGIGLIGFSVLSFTYSTGFVSLLLSFLVLRLGSSFFHPIGISTISRTYAGPSLQQSMSFQSAFGNMGVFLVFISVGPIYTLVGWKFTFIIYAAISLADALITLALLETPTITNQPLIDDKSNGRFQFLNFIMFFLAIAFVSGGSYAVILNLSNLFLSQHQLTLSLSQIDSIVSSFILASFLGALSIRFYRTRIDTATALIISYLSALIAISLFAFFPGDLWIASLGLIVCGFTLSATYPLTYTLLADSLTGTKHSSGSSFGALSSAQTVGASICGFVSGLIIPTLGQPSPFLFVALLMFVAAAVALSWKESHHSTPKKI